jgi:hypothetical protein
MMGEKTIDGIDAGYAYQGVELFNQWNADKTDANAKAFTDWSDAGKQKVAAEHDRLSNTLEAKNGGYVPPGTSDPNGWLVHRNDDPQYSNNVSAFIRGQTGASESDLNQVYAQGWGK